MLQREVRDKGISPIEFLPVLGREGYIRKRRSHLLAAFPKTGKTELVMCLLQEWAEEEAIYFSEEGEETWQDRAYELPDWPGKLELVFALDWTGQQVLVAQQETTASVVIIDTVRDVIKLPDESDPAKVAEWLRPYIDCARKKKQTLILLHHERKATGTGGRGVSGAHSFVGIVDIFLELDNVQGYENQRKLSGRGRIRTIEDLYYEKLDDGRMVPVEFGGDTRVFDAVPFAFMPTKEIAKLVGLSLPTTERHLKSLADQGRIVRDPSWGVDVKGQQVKWMRYA